MKVDLTQLDTKDRQGFILFYDRYAPKVWGLILSADLPESVAKTILVRTFVNAWQHPHRLVIGQNQVLTFLLSLAYAEGLPPDRLQLSKRARF